MKKVKVLFPILLLGLLTSCSGTSLPLHYDPNDTGVDEPWVEYNIPVESLSFADEDKNIVLEVGKSHVYNFSYTPKNATPSSLEWTVSNEAVAKVERNQDGKYEVKALSSGSATVTVSGGEGVLFSPITLNVEAIVKITGFSIEKKSYTFDYVDGSEALEIAYEPENTTQKDLIYEIEEGKEDMLSVNNGQLVASGVKAGSVKVNVRSAHLPEADPIELTVNLEDQYKYLEEFTITSTSTKIERGRTALLSVATALPNDHSANLASVIYQVVEGSDVISLDESSGEIKANKAGTAKVRASINQRNGAKLSNEIEITVFEVKIASISLGEDSKQVIELNNRKEVVSKQLSYTYELDDSAYEEPTESDIVYLSSGDAVTVTQEGLVTLNRPGTARVTVKDNYSGKEDYVDFDVIVEIESIDLSASRLEAYSDETITFTAVTTPVELSDGEITWNITNEEKLNVTKEGKTLKVSAKEEGIYTVSATNGDKTSKEISVEFTDRPGTFISGTYYIAGSSNFRSGTSTGTKSSWNDANRAAIANEKVEKGEGDPNNLDLQMRATITFKKGDEFKVRYGDKYLDNIVWVDPGDGSEYQRQNHYENAGAIESKDIVVLDGDDAGESYGNFKVVNEGTYRVLIKIYDQGKSNEWYSFYLDKKEFTLTENANVLVGKTKVIHAADWTGTPVISIDDDTVATFVHDGNGNITLTGLKEGTTTLNFADDNTTLHCAITVSAKPQEFEAGSVYLVGNADFSSSFATDTAEPMWNGAPAKSYLFTEELPVHQEGQKENLDYQIKAVVTFREGDEFKLMYGDQYVPTYTTGGDHYEHEESDTNNAITLQQIKVVNAGVSENGNYRVEEAGSYQITFKIYDKGASNEWLSVHLMKKELHVDKTYLPLTVEDETTIKASDWNGTLSVVSSDTDVVTATYNTTLNDGTIDVVAKAKGDATITLSDERKTVVVNVKVSKPFADDKVYLVGNKDYSSGTSAEGASWDDVDKALIFTETEKGNLKKQEKVTVTFAAGDQWRIRDGKSYADAVLENRGAIAGRQMHLDGENVVVDVAGTYEIFYKTGTDDGHSIYVSPESTTKAITITITNDDLKVGGCWYAVWAWTGTGAGHFYYGATINDGLYEIVVPATCDGYIVLRMAKGVDASAITSFPSQGDNGYWNKTGDITTDKINFYANYFYSDGSINVTTD